MSEPCYCGAHDCRQCYPAGFAEEAPLDATLESLAETFDALGYCAEQDPAMLEALEEDCREQCCPPVFRPEILEEYIRESRRELRARMNGPVALERYAELGKWVTALYQLHPTSAPGVMAYAR